MRLSLGTVQFGLRYGVANRGGQVGLEEAARILHLARDSGVDSLDTAVGYGAAEERLGSLGVADWKVTTKLPAIASMSAEARADIPGWLRSSVTASLARLKIERLYGLLLHRAADLREPQGPEVYAAMAALRASGLVQRIGVSIYDPEELQTPAGCALDLIQAPFNVLDRRLESSGWLERLHQQGVDVHTRSAFLQGLLLMDRNARPAYFARWSQLWSGWHQWLQTSGVSPLQACLSFALSRQSIDRVVVGVDSAAQLGEILRAAGTSAPLPPAAFASEDLDLLNPSRWPPSS